MLRPLRHGRLWLSIGTGLLVVALYLNLAPNDPASDIHGVDKVEHLVGWAGLTAWFGALFERRLLVGVALSMLAIGGCIELLQAWMAVGRHGDWHDLVADAVGVSLGLLVAGVRRESWFAWVEKWLPAT